MPTVDSSNPHRRLDWVMPVATVSAAAFGGWYVGLITYQWALRVVLGRQASANDLLSLGLWVSVGLAFVLPFGYLPLIQWLDARIVRRHLRVALGLVCGAALAPLPAAVLAMVWSGGRFSALWSAAYALMLVWTAVLGGILVAAGSVHSRFWRNVS